jgi:uncharacterized membrane protein YidH (DUF202 family)
MEMLDSCWNHTEGGFFQPTTGCVVILFLIATSVFLLAFSYIRWKDTSRKYKDEKGEYRQTLASDIQENYVYLTPLYLLCLVASFTIVQVLAMRMRAKDTEGKDGSSHGRFLDTSW